jgi:hypothetical protein
MPVTVAKRLVCVGIILAEHAKREFGLRIFRPQNLEKKCQNCVGKKWITFDFESNETTLFSAEIFHSKSNFGVSEGSAAFCHVFSLLYSVAHVALNSLD